jgi:hypothetical protein
MKRYLEYDEIVFSPHQILSTTNHCQSFVNRYTNCLIDELQQRFTHNYFQAILVQLEQLNNFKIEQISQHLTDNNRLVEEIHRLCPNQSTANKDEKESVKDDSIIHLSSTPAPNAPRPIYVNYKPVHMIYLREKLLIRNECETRLPLNGITNKFVADLINMKMIDVLDEITGKVYDIPTKWLYFAKSCGANVILPLKLRVAMIDVTTGQRRYGFIGEEPGKNNDYRCLIFFIDDLNNISANYYPSSYLHICLDQTYSTHVHECQNDFLERYFASYPERMMLRAKEGTMVKVRNVLPNCSSTHSSTFLPALVIQIDGSMMQIEFSHNKQRIWLYRGSPLLDQMNNYYSTQNQAAIHGLTRHTARQHLSARRSNAPEIICLNEQINRHKAARTAEQAIDAIDETSTYGYVTIDHKRSYSYDILERLKRVRLSNEQDLRKLSLTATKTASPSACPSSSVSPPDLTTTVVVAATATAATTTTKTAAATTTIRTPTTTVATVSRTLRPRQANTQVLST